LAFPTKGQAMGYLIAYGVGTVLAMGTFSSGLDWLARRPAFAVVSAYPVLMMSCSIIAIGVGVLWLGSWWGDS
jgi:hypothetical protein